MQRNRDIQTAYCVRAIQYCCSIKGREGEVERDVGDTSEAKAGDGAQRAFFLYGAKKYGLLFCE